MYESYILVKQALRKAFPRRFYVTTGINNNGVNVFLPSFIFPYKLANSLDEVLSSLALLPNRCSIYQLNLQRDRDATWKNAVSVQYIKGIAECQLKANALGNSYFDPFCIINDWDTCMLSNSASSIERCIFLCSYLLGCNINAYVATGRSIKCFSEKN